MNYSGERGVDFFVHTDYTLHELFMKIADTMKKIKVSVFILFCFIWFSSSVWSQGIRKPVWAGQFYEGQADALSKQIDRFLLNVKVKDTMSGKILALIAPHAGYPFSGQVAAYAYRLIQNQDYETVIIIGTSHHYGFEGCSIYPRGGYETPLGLAEIDEPLALELSNLSGYKYIPRAHQAEHSIEVQVPFVQKVLPNAKIVPIVMGSPSKSSISRLSGALVKSLKNKNAVVIVSTDMSHYLPKKRANEVDSQTISLIKSFKTNSLIRKLEQRENILCGGGGVVSALLYAQKLGKAEVNILNYADSSLAGGPESQVVGYLAASIFIEPPGSKFSLSSEEKKALLHVARSSVNLFVQENKILDYRTQNPKFLSNRGAFVTIKKRGLLRGCIGFIEPALPLYQTIIQASIYAACRDARFGPVSPSELKDLEIEISVLSPLKKIKDTDIIEVGRHGLLISKGKNSGLLLPQVPVENHWSRLDFLQNTCLKAGLPRNAWKSGAGVFIFEAIVFH